MIICADNSSSCVQSTNSTCAFCLLETMVHVTSAKPLFARVLSITILDESTVLKIRSGCVKNAPGSGSCFLRRHVGLPSLLWIPVHDHLT